MGKRIKKAKKQKEHSGRIPAAAIERKLIRDENSVVFSFSFSCDQHCLLWEWSKEELKILIRRLKEIEQLTWDRIRTSNSLKYEPNLDRKRLAFQVPYKVSPEESIFSVRITQTARLFGFRNGNVFAIIWFDRNHEVFSGKTRRTG